MNIARSFLLLILLWSTLVGMSAADTHAVVVGIDQYAAVDAGLRGCVNDAKAMEKALADRGINAKVLLNDQATRESVLQALNEGKGSDTILFYFAGLGSGPSTPRLILHDDRKGIELEELDQLILSLDTENATVILDTCFAGSRAEKSGPSPLKNRYYRPEQPRSRSLATLGADSTSIPGVSHEKVCYVTASRFNEEAFESRFGGENHGLFTYYLCERLATGDQVSWRGIQWDVGAKVAAHGADQQHPKFPSNFLASGIGFTDGEALAGRPNPTAGGSTQEFEPKPIRGSLWNLFNIDNEERSRVRLSMIPNQSEVLVEQPLEFEVTVGDQGGYLLVVEHSVEGTLRPIFPRDGDLAKSQVRPGQRVVIPDSQTIAYADRPGKERVKAFLFQDKEMAGQLLSGLASFPIDTSQGPKFGAVSEQLRSRSIQFVPAAEFGASAKRDLNSGSKIPYTDDLYFQVVSKDLSPAK